MIAVRAPSNQKPYDEFWSGDPAFVQPDPTDIPATREHYAKVKRARDTGEWNELLVPGKTPTKFVMQPLKGEQIRWIYDRNNCSDAEKEMGNAVSLALCFRCAIVEIHNLGIDYTLKFVEHPHLGKIADADVVNLLDTANQTIVTELGLLASMRARELSPL